MHQNPYSTTNALIFGKNKESHETKIIINASKPVLYHQQQVWIKANNNNSSKLFDITMGGKHDATNW